MLNIFVVIYKVSAKTVRKNLDLLDKTKWRVITQGKCDTFREQTSAEIC